ncbi:MAG TPA: hypothetical protein VNN73_22760 [Blastocatellia bacterium]|nr:hypothetical protein [Blastocatellia bacterium]
MLVDNAKDYLAIRDMLADIKDMRFKIDWVETSQSAQEKLKACDYALCVMEFFLAPESGA